MPRDDAYLLDIQTSKVSQTSEVYNGFKETEIGPIPVDWDVVPLGKAVQYRKFTVNPQSYPEETFDYYSIPAYQVSKEPALERGSEIRSQKLVVEPGMVLFGKLNPRVPKVWCVASVSGRRKIASTEFIPLIPIDGKTLSEFVYYLSWSEYVLPKSQELVSGSTPSRQRVDVKAFLDIPVPLPSLSEQRRIAHVLNTIQRAIAAQDGLIAAAREVKRSLMQRLFTYGPGPGPAPTKETEIGELPEHWEVVRFQDWTTLVTKGSSPKWQGFDYCERGIAFVRSQNVGLGTLDLADIACLPEEFNRRHRTSVVTVQGVAAPRLYPRAAAVSGSKDGAFLPQLAASRASVR